MKKFLIPAALILVFIALIFFVKNKQKEVAVVTPATPLEMCYQYYHQTSSNYTDAAWLKMSITGANVTGEYQNLPAQKDSKTGKFSGTVGAMDPNTSSRTADVLWESMAEGSLVKEQLKISFGEGSAVALFGEMVDRGDGVYVYKDANNLTPGFQMSQVDCEKLFERTSVTVMVPTDIAGYDKAMTKYLQTGGKNPLTTWPFVKQAINTAYSIDIIRASANAAAGVLHTQTVAKVAYMKIKSGTAYVLLNIDLDGWAGSSVATGRIHPLVEKTLLQFPQIKKVVFGFAKGDNKPNAY